MRCLKLGLSRFFVSIKSFIETVLSPGTNAGDQSRLHFFSDNTPIPPAIKAENRILAADYYILDARANQPPLMTDSPET
jgi:hypothetical protein